MKKLLIVDDEKNIRHMICKYGKFEGYDVSDAEDATEAIALCSVNTYDIIIMDVMMPGMNGFDACAEIKKINSTTPIIMLSARGEEYDKIRGFELGIDDYVVKPFSPKELMMRIHAILKRCERAENKNETYDLEGIHVDFTSRIITIDGKKVEMAPREYALFFYLIRNKNIALKREKLITDVWGYDFEGDERTLDTHIKMLRKYLGKYSSHIVTLRGVGYRFED